MQIGFLLGSIVKIAALLAYIYGLLWVLGHSSKWVKLVGIGSSLWHHPIGFIAQHSVDFQILTGLRQRPAFPGFRHGDGRDRVESDLRLQWPVQPGAMGILRHRGVRLGGYHVSVDSRGCAWAAGGRHRRDPGRADDLGGEALVGPPARMFQCFRHSPCTWSVLSLPEPLL